MQNGERRLRRRFFALTVVFVGGIGLLALYLFSMQIVRGGEYRQRAREVSSREAVIPAQRGEVFDRNADIPLVFNVDSFAVDLSPAEVPPEQLPALLERLASALSLPMRMSQFILTEPLKIRPSSRLTTQPLIVMLLGM